MATSINTYHFKSSFVPLAMAARTGRSRPAIPIDRDHSFQLIAATRSDGSRPPIPGDRDHLWMGGDGRRWVIRESAWLRSFSIGSGTCLDRDYPCVKSATC